MGHSGHIMATVVHKWATRGQRAYRLAGKVDSMARITENPMPHPYYVTGELPSGSASFGVPCTGLARAEEECRWRHERGYRRLRVYRTEDKAVAHFDIRNGIKAFRKRVYATKTVDLLTSLDC